MINSRLSVAIHILSIIATYPHGDITSELIASSVNTNPVVIRRMIGLLKKAGILTAKAGVPGASLTKEPADLSLLDIYKAIQSKDELFAIHDNPNPNCPIGKEIQATLNKIYENIQTAMENELANKSLKDVLEHLF